MKSFHMINGESFYFNGRDVSSGPVPTFIPVSRMAEFAAMSDDDLYGVVSLDDGSVEAEAAMREIDDRQYQRWLRS